MTAPKRRYIKKNRPAQAGELVGVRLQPDGKARIDAWRTAQSTPMTRPEAMRVLMVMGLDAHNREPSLFDLSDLVFADGLNRPSEPEAPPEDLDIPPPPLDETWPEDLRDSFIVAPEPDSISRLHEIVVPPKPLPEKPLDLLGPLGPIGTSAPRRKR